MIMARIVYALVYLRKSRASEGVSRPNVKAGPTQGPPEMNGPLPPELDAGLSLGPSHLLGVFSLVRCRAY